MVLWRMGQEVPKLEQKTFQFVIGTSDALYDSVKEDRQSESGIKSVSGGTLLLVSEGT